MAIPQNPEHFEAYQLQVNKELEEFTAKLPENKKIAMQKLREAVGECERQNVPILFVAGFENRYYQWNSLKTDENAELDRYSQEFYKIAWEKVLPGFLNTVTWFLSGAYQCKFKVYSLLSKELIFQNPPEKLEDDKELI